MSPRAVLGAWGGCALAATAVSWSVLGPHAGVGFLLGVAGTSAGMLGWWAAIRLLGQVFRDEKSSLAGGCLTVAFLFLKLPMILLAWQAATRMGPPAPAFFLYGLALVYFATIHWALSQR